MNARIKMNTTAVVALAALLGYSGQVSAQVIFNETFGNTSTRVPSPYVPQFSGAGALSYYQFADPEGIAGSVDESHFRRAITDGFYAVINPQNIRDVLPPPLSATPTNQAGEWWASGAAGFDPSTYRDHTGDNGAVLAVNAGATQNHMYRRLVTLAAGNTYELSAWVFTVQAPGNTQLSLREPDDSAALASSPNFMVAPTGDPALHNWTRRSWKFTIPGNCAQTDYAVAYSNLDTSTAGNDLFIDDISLTQTTDTTGATLVTCASVISLTLSTQPDAATTPMNTPVTINVTDNDSSSDPTGAPLAAPSADTSPTAIAPANGTVSYAGGQPQYTPDTGFTGTDQFTYQVCTTPSATHPTAVCETGTVTVTINAVVPPTNPSAIAPVPVNSPWAILLMGVGVLGLAMKRSKD